MAYERYNTVQMIDIKNIEHAQYNKNIYIYQSIWHSALYVNIWHFPYKFGKNT